MPKLSVIIPIYNVEQYLPKCLDSVINQTYKDLEIICVNDCSPDNSLKICKEYATKDSRIKIINREKNGGLSAARNSGLDNASGEYIYFIDSDDYIDLDYVEKMVEMMTIAKTDIVLNLNSKIKDSKYSFFTKQHIKQSNCYLNPKMLADKQPWSAWSALYNRDFIEKYKIRFPEGYVCEDIHFHYFVYLYAQSLYVFDGPSYYYTVRENSIMHSNNDIDLMRLNIFELIYEDLSRFGFLDLYKLRLLYPPLKIQNNEKYTMFKDYICKISSYLQISLECYNKLELFCISIICDTSSYKDYIDKYGKDNDLSLTYLRSKTKNMDFNILIEEVKCKIKSITH